MDHRTLTRMMESILRPIRQRIMMAIARGILETTDDSKGIQLCKVSLMKDEVREGLERVQNFGFTSNPPDESELVALFIGGNREHGFVVSCEHRTSRMKNLEKGSCAIYTNDGTYILLKKGGEVEVKAATKLTVDVPNCTFKGNIKVEGAVVVDQTINATGVITGSNVVGGGTSLSAIKSTFNGHTHQAGSIPLPDQQL